MPKISDMRRFTRQEEPEILKGKAQDMGQHYAEKRKSDNSYRFQWPTKIYKDVRSTLANQTDNHCSYCDGFPLGQGDETIDHFKPKTDEKFYHLVAHWHNLYLGCNDCQKSKMTQYDESLLRPDAEGYNFGQFFTYNYSSNELLPNPASSQELQERAEVTIKIFNLNHPSLKISRKYALTCYGSGEYQLNDLPFRYLFE